MLRKLAETAQWLDEHGLHAEADIVTDVLRKYAANEFFEEDFDDDVPEIDPYESSMYHNIRDLDLNNPEHIDVIRQHHPDLAQSLADYVPARARASTAPFNFAGRSIVFPPGFKGEFEKRANEFFMTPETLNANREAFLSRLDRATRGRKRRATFDLDYASTSSPGYERTYIYDPKLEELLASDPSIATGENNINLFDRDRLRALYDPRFDLSTLDEKDSADREKYLTGVNPRTNEPYSLPQQLGWARRQVKPESTMKIRGHRAEMGDDGKRKPNYYFRVK